MISALWLRLLWLGFVCLVTNTATAGAVSTHVESKSNDNDNNNNNNNNNENVSFLQDDLIAWVRSRGGSFSDKLEIRRVDPDDPTSYRGVFVKSHASASIAANESLFAIPRDCYIHVFDTADTIDSRDSDNVDDDDDDDEANDKTIEANHLGNLCQLAQKLTEEMTRGADSVYAPYIAYLKTQAPGQLPVNWSRPGKDLLRRVAVPGSLMVDWIDRNFRENCIGEMTNAANDENDKNDDDSSHRISFEEHMVEMTIQRCFDMALIPIWDMVNHDNGRINTVQNSIYDEDGLKVSAARDLAPGEELFATYDKCLDCLGVDEYWGTPEILKDFGFVENYPHRWVFLEQHIWIEIQQDYEFETSFGNDDNDDEDDIPTDEQVDFLMNELDRLEEVEELYLNHREQQGNVPDHEWNTILRFHQAAFNDLYEVVEWYTTEAGDYDQDDDVNDDDFPLNSKEDSSEEL